MAKGDGRKIATWTVEKDGFKIPVVVRMRKDSFDQTEFVVDHIQQSPLIEVKDRDLDIDALEKRVRTSVAEQISVEWKPYLWIKTRGKKIHYSANDANDTYDLTISITRVEIANLTGGEVWRERKQQRQSLDDVIGTVRPGRPDTGVHDERPGWSRGSGNNPDAEMWSLVEDNDVNRAALDAITTGMMSLRNRLQDLLSPEKIALVLPNIKTMPLLGVGSPPADRK